jgi:CDP-glucose 4,6-dehydratase
VVIGPRTLENMVVREFWCNKRVFLTGHTGFKGGWLALWLTDMGAEVHGYALQPPTDPSFFSITDLQVRLAGNTIADIRDASALNRSVQDAQPEFVFHLAAQPLVRHSYREPVETYGVNVMGTVNLLEIVRQTSATKAVINVTSDKCYDNREWLRPYGEEDALGGFDPYSSSKACAELVSSAYRRSFLETLGIQLATVRAGNVIGGGDWAEDRLIPDFFRAQEAGQPLLIRSPHAVRPWQHVLEPLAGYLKLAQRLYTDGEGFAEAWNFGPEEADARPVEWIADYLSGRVPGAGWRNDSESHPHEAQMLRLDTSKAKARLDWRPLWSLGIALDKTLEWYAARQQGMDMAATSLQQIHEYEVAMQS